VGELPEAGTLVGFRTGEPGNGTIREDLTVFLLLGQL